MQRMNAGQYFFGFWGQIRSVIFQIGQSILYFEIFVQSSMPNISTLLSHALTHIIIEGQLSPAFYLIVSIVATLQTISVIAAGTDLFQVVKWFDPSTYQNAGFIMLIGLALCLAFLIVLFLRVLISQKSQEILRNSIIIQYVGTILLYLQTVCKTVVLIPLLRACLLVIQNPSSPVMLGLSIFAMLLYLLLLPIHIYHSLNTFVLTPQLNKKLNYLNAYAWVSTFRVILVLGNILNSASMPFLCGINFFVYICITLKRPIFAYTYEKAKKAMLSAIGYSSIIQVLNSIAGSTNSALSDILGMFCFAALIEIFSAVRIKKILELQKPTIYQLKVLLFMITHFQQQLGNLEYFILNHQQKCKNPACLCASVIAHLTTKGANLKDQKIWYQFFVSYAKYHYCLEQIVKLPESQLLAKVNKYKYIIVDLVEISLFKLGKLNEAYYTLSNFQALLYKKKIDSQLFEQKRTIMKFYMQDNIEKLYRNDGAINQYADRYMNFQIQFQNYRKLLLKAASKTGEIWEEMNKRQPYQKKLLQDIRTIQVWNHHIRILYDKLVQQFQKVDEVLEEITQDYFKMVLNISQKIPLAGLEIHTFQNAKNKKKQKIQRLSQNMQSFSYDSQTPMCFVSVENEDRGKIKHFNHFFSQMMKVQYGKFVSIEQLLIPQMRDFHSKKMQQFINGDILSREHKNGLTLNSKGRLIYTKILIQMMPSIDQGLQYVIFFKKLLLQKRVFGIKNTLELVYPSQSFERFMKQKFGSQSIMTYLTPQTLKQLKKSQKIQLKTNEGNSYEVTKLYEFNQNDSSYLFLEILELKEFEYSSANLSKASRFDNTATNGFSKKDQVIQLANKSWIDIDQQNPGSAQNSDHNEKEGLQKQRKGNQKIRQIYEIILNRKDRQLSSSMNRFIRGTSLIKMGLLAVVILLKYQNQNDYLAASDVNDKYSQFILLVSRLALKFKQINLYMYTNTSTLAVGYMFKNLQTQPLIGTTMDNFLYMFDIPTVSQSWNVFNVNNKSITVSSQNNFLSVADTLINPVTNLLSANVSSFNFSFAIDYLPTNASATSTFFYQLITNAIYVQLPGFRGIKEDIMNPIIKGNLSNFYNILIVNLLLFFTIVCWLIWILYKHTRILKLKTASYKFLQKLKGELIKQKYSNCLKFHQKYSYSQAQLRTEDKPSKITENAYDKTIEGNSQFDSQEQKEYELKTNPLIFCQQLKSEQPQQTSNLKKSKAAVKSTTLKIFDQISFAKTTCKYTLPCIPLIVYLIVFTFFEFKENQQLINTLKIQENIQTMQQDSVIIRLYSMHYGTYNSSLEQYLSIPETIQKLVTQMFAYEKLCLNSYVFDNLPLLQDYVSRIYYGNVCQLEQQGLFTASNYTFYGKGSLTNCLSTNNQMLTKGFIASLLNFIESANTLWYANPNTIRYNSTQRLAYLNSPFFTEVAKMGEYFDLIYDTALRLVIKDYNNLVWGYSFAITVYCSVLILWFVIVMLFFRRYYLNIVKRDILEIHSIFSLIAYESLVKNDYLKGEFAGQMEDFRLLE